MTRRIASITVSLFASLVFAAASSQAQVPENLAQPKAFRALRIASTDPKFKNGDFRPIAPGATLELGRIEGHGQITHMWFTINGKSADHLRELVLRMYWDGAEKPASSARSAISSAWASAATSSTRARRSPSAASRRSNCYWPMPFAKGARLTMTNEGSEPVPSCYFNIDYRLDDQPAARTPATSTRSTARRFPCPRARTTRSCETTGRGHFVGTFLSVMANSDGWWGEGNDKFYVDGDEEAHDRRHRQRRLFLRGLGFPARLLESV